MNMIVFDNGNMFFVPFLAAAVAPAVSDCGTSTISSPSSSESLLSTWNSVIAMSQLIAVGTTPGQMPISYLTQHVCHLSR